LRSVERDNDILLSIIVPVFNEERVLRETIDELHAYFRENGAGLELIIVDDNSADRSLDIIKEGFCKNSFAKILVNGTREKKAVSIKNGVKEARGRYVIFMDADLSVPLKEISKVLGCIKNGADIIIGIRDEGNKDMVVRRPIHRKIISRIYNAVCGVLFFNGKIKDVGCGFKAFKTEIARELFSSLYIKTWVFDAEILSRALKSNYEVTQIFVNWTYKGHSKINIYRDLLVAFFELVRLKLFFMSGQED